MKLIFLLMVEVGMVAATFAENRQPNMSSDTKPIVRLSVAFMVIGEQDLTKIGKLPPDTGDGALQPMVVFNILYDLIRGNNPSSTACVRASLDNTKHTLARSGITRMSETRSAFIENGSKGGVKFRSGGSWFIKVGDGDSIDLKELDYGITVMANGAMVYDTMMSLDFGCDIRTIIPTEDGSFNWKDGCSKQKIICPIGHTTLVSGFGEMIDKSLPPQKIRRLSSIPLLNWFVDYSGEKVSDRRLVIMVCPEIVDGSQSVMPDDNKVINIPLSKPNKHHKWGRGWSWFDWFIF